MLVSKLLILNFQATAIVLGHEIQVYGTNHNDSPGGHIIVGDVTNVPRDERVASGLASPVLTIGHYFNAHYQSLRRVEEPVEPAVNEEEVDVDGEDSKLEDNPYWILGNLWIEEDDDKAVEQGEVDKEVDMEVDKEDDKEDDKEVDVQADTSSAAEVSEECFAWIYDLLVEHLNDTVFKDLVAMEEDTKIVDTNETQKVISDEKEEEEEEEEENMDHSESRDENGKCCYCGVDLILEAELTKHIRFRHPDEGAKENVKDVVIEDVKEDVEEETVEDFVDKAVDTDEEADFLQDDSNEGDEEDLVSLNDVSRLFEVVETMEAKVDENVETNVDENAVELCAENDLIHMEEQKEEVTEDDDDTDTDTDTYTDTDDNDATAVEKASVTPIEGWLIAVENVKKASEKPATKTVEKVVHKRKVDTEVLGDAKRLKPNEIDEKVKALMTKGDWNVYTDERGRERRVWFCKLCPKEGEYSVVRDHVDFHHLAELTRPCQDCDKTFNTKNSLRRHMKSDHSIGEVEQVKGKSKTKMACNQCDYVSAKSGNMKRHMKLKHRA